MRLFRKRKPDVPPGLEVKDPLAVVPVVADGVESRVDNHNLIQIRKEFAPCTRVQRFCTKVLRMRRVFRLNLDEMGTCFWRQIDGRRNVEQIAAALSKEYDLEEKKAVAAVIAFTRSLMLRHIINLEVPPDARPGAGKGRKR